ncbi:MAG TPA: isoprenylcysteine carboxylmethyltransferase family protein [Vicinamibacterales bacterium]|nr:isoprenylcysteine carboxylmethyltransferase family protein [Vicinamibacterales bacterium]
MARGIVLAIAVFGTMLIEARRAARNERVQRDRGGVEPPDDVYRVMRIAYPLAFAAMLGEGFLRQPVPAGLVATGMTLFAAAKALKWWAILSLGRFWTFRVIVVPGVPLIRRGPYRWLRHPNYVGVVGELVGVAVAAGAAVFGVAAMTGFGLLLVKRIRVEERMLATAPRGAETSK